MTRDDNVLLNDVYFNAYNTNPPLTPLTPISKLFASFDGIGVHSGVPTRTTPTLTPTTLKNIEQTFIEANNDAQVNLPYQAGFVPPPYPMEEHSQDRDASQESLSSTSNGSWHVSGSHGYTGDDLDSKSSASLEHSPTLPSTGGASGAARGRRSAFAAGLSKAGSSNGSSSVGGPGGAQAGGSGAAGGGSSGRRNVGGRRPHKPSNLSPEEEEKRRIRRERNKQAAARCRRRREDHTNELVDETDLLEKKRQSLTREIQVLQQEKDDLEFLLESHREHCRLRARLSPIELKIKTEPEEDLAMHQQPPPPQQQQQQDLQVQMVAEALQQEHQSSSRGPIAKKLKLSNELSDSLETPTPTTLFAPLIGKVAPGGSRTTGTSSERPSRPDSLDVKTAQFPMLSIRSESLAQAAAAAAVGISTPSNGLFNFDSLMEGGTGLTPIAAPITFPPNRNPLELITPTSTEPSKLCSL